jgi:hypothetical protein
VPLDNHRRHLGDAVAVVGARAGGFYVHHHERDINKRGAIHAGKIMGGL